MGNETFIDWRLGTQAGFDSVVPLGSRHDELQCRRPGTAPLSDWSRAITPHGQRTWVDEGPSASARFARLSNTDKLGMALRSAAQAVGPEMGHKLLELISPTNLAIMAGALAIWVGAHATPVGWVVDIGMVGLGVVALGAEAVNVMRELYAFAMGVIKARSEIELMQAGRHLAKAIAIVGVDVVVALLLKKAIVKVRQPRAHGSEAADGPKLFGKYDPKDAAKSLPAEPVGAKAPDTTSRTKNLIAAKGGATNIAAHETYKDGLRAAMSKPAVSDPALARLIDPLYRPNATVGSGSTAAAIRQELVTGQSVGGAFHSQKAADSIRALEHWLSKNPAARPGDRAAAENVIRDMSNALRGW